MADDVKITRDAGGTISLLGRIVFLLAVGISLFQLYTGFAGPLVAMKQRIIHLAVLSMIIFLTNPARKAPDGRKRVGLFDWVMSALALSSAVFMMVRYDHLVLATGALDTVDITFGVFVVLVVLEAVRRTIGLPLLIIATAAIAYAFLGPYMPGMLSHKAYSIGRVVEAISYNTEGILGTPLGVSATFIYMFILFGAFMERSKAGETFIDTAYAITGGMQGGPAETAVVSSALMGTVSGSAVANVVTTGTFTIPLMKRTGYKPEFAGAVEAVSSSGGQIMPPVMGASAFVMSELTGIPYLDIAKRAALPAILYYLAEGVQVYLEAGKLGLKGMAREELPKIRETLKKGGHLFIPLLLLVALLVMNYTPMKAGAYAIFGIVLVAMARPFSRMSMHDILKALEAGAYGAMETMAACACAGIVIGIVNLTGLGLTLSSFIVSLSHGLLPVALVLTMIASLILGMGLPTVACYLILAVLVAPALVKMGVTLIAAHMFIFYFGVISAITPPVALAAYAAAGIAGSSPMKVGWIAVRLGLTAFIVPYMFIYGPELLLQGTLSEVLLAVASSVTGVALLAIALEGWLRGPLGMVRRVMALAGAFLLIKPGIATDIAGLVLLILVILPELRGIKWKKKSSSLTD